MKFLLRLSALFAFAMFGMNSCFVSAQDDGVKAEIDEAKIEAWAEKHAEEWEKWGEKFEAKMEKWAKSQEKQWEKWADKYSKRMENWAEQLESGEFDPEELQSMIDHNLDMLKDMPIESLIDGALKEGLGELKNAPFDSLSELQGLIGGSLEKSLEAMEQELSAVAGAELQEKLKGLKTKDLHKAIEKLQGSIEIKSNKGDQDTADTISKLEKALEKSSKLDSEQKDKILEAVQRELADARALRAKNEESHARARDARDKAEAASARAKEMAALAERLARQATMNKANLDKLKASRDAQKLADEARKMAMESMKRSKSSKKTKKDLEQHYNDLKKQKAELEDKESAIAEMKREIMKLRKEVERMKKEADK